MSHIIFVRKACFIDLISVSHAHCIVIEIYRKSNKWMQNFTSTRNNAFFSFLIFFNNIYYKKQNTKNTRKTAASILYYSTDRIQIS